MSFFDKPNGVGAQLNIYMFTPKNILKNIMTAVSQPRYFWNRLCVLFYQQTNPGYPWLTAESIKLIEAFLNKNKTGLEWGSGKSTLWFAQRLEKLISVEHNKKWYNRMSTEIDDHHVKNIDYRYACINNGCLEYSQQIENTDIEYFDFVLVDGECRSQCLAIASKKMKLGGYLVLDNADKDYDMSGMQLDDFQIIRTNNGVWRTDIFIYQPKNIP